MRKSLLVAACLALCAAQVGWAAEPGTIDGFYLTAIKEVRVRATQPGMLILDPTWKKATWWKKAS